MGTMHTKSSPSSVRFKPSHSRWWRMRERYLARLKRAGWESIGEGAYSNVMAHEDHPDMVIKVGRPEHAERDGYPHYITWAAEQHSLPAEVTRHFPKVTKIHHTASFYVAHLERLRVCDMDDPGSLSAIRELQPDSTLREAVDLVEYTFTLNFHMDMWANNFMRRADGTVVITDPLADKRSFFEHAEVPCLS